MRRLAISLLFLCPLTVSGQTLQLSPETPIADLNYGGVVTGIPAVLPDAAGFAAYVNIDGELWTMPVAADGNANVAARKAIGPEAQVVMSAGRPLRFWTENHSIVAARLNSTPVAVIANATLQNVGCDDHGCLVSFFSGNDTIASVVVTDSEARPLTDKTALPDFRIALQFVTTIVPDAGGFTLYRGGTIGAPQRLVRIDRSGNLVYDVGTIAPYQTVCLVPVGDHAVLVTQTLINGEWDVTSMNVSSTDGSFSASQKLVKLASQFGPFAVNDHVLAVTNGQHVALFNLNADVTSTTPAGGFDLPTRMTLMATVSNSSSTIALLGTTTFFTMRTATGSTPSPISYGVLHQQPRGIVSMGSEFLVMWSEIDTVSGVETLRAAFVSPEGVVRNGFEVGRSLATSVLPLTTVGGDALVLWYDDDQRQSRGGIVHPDGSVNPVKLGTSIAARSIVATDSDWIVFAGNGATGLVGLHVSHSGAVSPSLPLSTALNVVFGAATDGTKILLLVPTETMLISRDLRIEQRHAATFMLGGSIAFSGDAYLFADGKNLVQLDASGVVGSQTPFAFSLPTMMARPEGWAVFANSAVTLVTRGDPPVAVITLPLPGGDVRPWVASAGDTTGLLYARDAAVYFCTMQFSQATRHRAIGSR